MAGLGPCRSKEIPRTGCNRYGASDQQKGFHVITTGPDTGTRPVKMAATFESLKGVALADTAFDRYVSRNHSDMYETEEWS